MLLNSALAPLAFAVDYLSLDHEKLTILAVLMGFDMLTGTIKAYVLGRDVTSRRWMAGFLSKCTILIIPLALALMAKGVGAELNWFVGFAMSLMVVSETYSIIGNIYALKTKQEVTELDAISAIVNTLRGVFETMLRDKK